MWNKKKEYKFALAKKTGGTLAQSRLNRDELKIPNASGFGSVIKRKFDTVGTLVHLGMALMNLIIPERWGAIPYKVGQK